MSTIIKNGDAGFTIYTKGASEIILKKCTKVMDREGNVGPFGPKDRENMINKVIQPFAQVIGFKNTCITLKMTSFSEFSF